MRKYILLFFIIVSHYIQAQFRVKDAFPALTFAQPVELTGAGDGTNRLFIVSKPGVIYVLPNSSTASAAGTFLDMRNKVFTTNSDERGLLGLVFHPAYRQNGYFYVSYNRRPDGARVISRFKVSTTNRNLADVASERILLTYAQPLSNHNGGKIAFGKDGYLYIATGDGGGAGDPNNNAQNLRLLLGKMLRIDVNNTSQGLNYAIPADNPFANNTLGVRKEIFAYGLRNPWKFSVDPVTGIIVLGDVGLGQREEVNVIVKGGNYGWRLKEGSLCYNPAPAVNCDTITSLVPPVYEYSRTPTGGNSVTGGFVYRGKIPYLYEKYVYGDFASGNIWALTANPADTSVTNQFLLKFPGLISSFGEDDQRELYICNYSNGKIYKITDDAIALSYLVSPSNGAVGVTSGAYVANLVPGANSYTIELNTNASFTGTSLVQTSTNRIIGFSSLTLGQTYYGRVKTNLSPNWGRTISFTTAGSPVARAASLEEEVNKASSYIHLYPNPFTEYINIHSGIQENGPVKITITDLQGRILSKTSFQANQPIKVGNDLAAGVYILQIMQGEKINTFRVVKSSF